MKNTIILILIFICGMLYGKNLKLQDTVLQLQSLEHKVYLQKIHSYVPGIEYKIKERKDYENRYKD